MVRVCMYRFVEIITVYIEILCHALALEQFKKKRPIYKLMDRILGLNELAIVDRHLLGC